MVTICSRLRGKHFRRGRSLHGLKPGVPERHVLKQVQNLQKRIFLFRNRQAAGVSNLLLCVICMFLLFGGQLQVAQAYFAVSLILIIVSLLLSLW
jgi:Protein of unknown function (DUF2721)